MAQITQIITIHDYNKMTDEQKAALSENNMLAVVQQDWQQVRINAAIAAMQGMLSNPAHQKVQSESGEPFGYFYAMNAIMCADVLVAELKRSDDVYAECRRMDAINTASVCENMTKIQKELQKKGGDNGKSN